MALNEHLLVRFQLYRVKLIRPHQNVLTADNRSLSELLVEAIQLRPEEEVSPGKIWHLGNVKEIPDANALYFAVGRTTKSTVEKFDEKSKDFVEEPLETSPYTHCLILSDIGLAAIAHKSRLAPRTQGVARRLQSLLGRTDSVVRNDIRVEVRPVPDPQGFIAAIQSAYALLGFTATFRGPNPIDADEIFQRPLAVIASKTAAEEGQVKLRSTDLDRDAVASISRSTAATGNKASARIRDSERSRPRTVNMEQSPVEMVYSEEEVDPPRIAADLRARYQEVRGNE